MSSMRRAEKVSVEKPGYEEEPRGKSAIIPGRDNKNLVTSHFGIVLDLASSLMGMKQQQR